MMRDPRMFGVGGMAPPAPPAAGPAPSPAPGPAFAPVAAGVTHLPLPRALAPAAPPQGIPTRMYLGAALLAQAGKGDLANAFMQRKRDELAEQRQQAAGNSARDLLAKALLMRQIGGG